MSKRLVIYAKDIMNLTGRRERVAYKLLSQIRNKFGMEKGSMVSVKQFCSFTGLKVEDVMKHLDQFS